jgi:hypothetical protein
VASGRRADVAETWQEAAADCRRTFEPPSWPDLFLPLNNVHLEGWTMAAGLRSQSRLRWHRLAQAERCRGQELPPAAAGMICLARRPRCKQAPRLDSSWEWTWTLNYSKTAPQSTAISAKVHQSLVASAGKKCKLGGGPADHAAPLLTEGPLCRNTDRAEEMAACTLKVHPLDTGPASI